MQLEELFHGSMILLCDMKWTLYVRSSIGMTPGQS